MIRSTTTLLALAVAVLVPHAARGFEPAPTHPGLTGRAVLQSRLHTFLHKECGWELGLFEELRLDRGQTGRRRYNRLTRDLRRLDPAGGYRSDEKTGALRAVAWCLAGSVLAQRPASLNRHHFYCPPLRAGLDDSGPIVGELLALLAMLEGSDTVREFFTGTGFDLTGKPAPAWVLAGDNDLSIPALYRHLARSISTESAAARRHHLALALLAMGGVLHVIQDMASPTHARNDFRIGHLQRLGLVQPRLRVRALRRGAVRPVRPPARERQARGEAVHPRLLLQQGMDRAGGHHVDLPLLPRHAAAADPRPA